MLGDSEISNEEIYLPTAPFRYQFLQVENGTCM